MSEGDKPEKELHGEAHSTVEFLMRRMRHKGDLPAFSGHIVEINSKLSSLTAITFSSAGDLAKIILKDYSLTSKLLKVVNSALYVTLSGKVATVSKAVLLLGFEKTRLIAVTLLIFEHLQSKAQAMELKETAIGSCMSGLIAMDIADNLRLGSREEVFICAMLHSLGKMLAICYLPEEYAEIKKRMAQKGLDETLASQSVMGVTYAELGMAVSRSWNFPDNIVRSMETPPAGVIAPQKAEHELLRNISSYSNELFGCFMNTQEEDRAAALAEVSARYHNSIPLSLEQMESIITSSMAKIDDYSDIIRADRKSSLFLQDLIQRKQQQLRQHKLQESKQKEEGAVKAGKGVLTRAEPLASASSPESHPPEALLKETSPDILTAGLQEIHGVMAGHFILNDVLYMILETMYRGLEFNRVIFCLMDAAKSKMVARFGLGENVDEIVPCFQFLTGQHNDVFNVGIAQTKGLPIYDATAPNISRNIPDWYKQIVGAPSFAIYPLTVKGSCIGMFYADKKEKGQLLTDAQQDDMERLRDRAIEAITKKHP